MRFCVFHVKHLLDVVFGRPKLEDADKIRKVVARVSL